MTVKELMEVLECYEKILGERFTSLPIVMVGHDANGERQYDIPMVDYTFNVEDDRFTLWDN
jgi:hypothetical protein